VQRVNKGERAKHKEERGGEGEKRREERETTRETRDQRDHRAIINTKKRRCSTHKPGLCCAGNKVRELGATKLAGLLKQNSSLTILNLGGE